jgi:hypothetical protein
MSCMEWRRGGCWQADENAGLNFCGVEAERHPFAQSRPRSARAGAGPGPRRRGRAGGARGRCCDALYKKRIAARREWRGIRGDSSAVYFVKCMVS